MFLKLYSFSSQKVAENVYSQVLNRGLKEKPDSYTKGEKKEFIFYRPIPHLSA